MMRVKYIAFLAGRRQQQQFSIVVDGKPMGVHTATNSEARQILVPVIGSGSHVIEFRIDNPISPRQLGLSIDDDRQLGIGILELQLVTSSAQ